MKQKLFVSLILYFICYSLTAQEEFVNPPARLITKFPFTMLSGGIVILDAQLDDYSDTLHFVFDTGSGGISLDSTTVNLLGIKKEPSDKTIRGIAGIRTVEFAYNHQLKLPGLVVEHLDFHINDYELLSSVYGMKIDGIIGYSFLRRYIVRMDYDLMMMEVYTPGMYKYPKGGYLLQPNFTNLPMQQLEVEDARQFLSSMYLDTGAGLCLLFSQEAIEDSALLRKKRKLFPTQAEGLGGKRQMNLTVIKSVKIGPYKFRNVPVYIFEDDYNVTNYPILTGLLGNDLMRRFNVVINYPEKVIHIKPNTHFTDEFDYSYTGLGIYQQDGLVIVEDVMKGSPGERAGFKRGDIIIGIQNNLNGNIQSYKSLLQSAGNTLKILVMRNNEPWVLQLTVRHILRRN